MTIPAVSSLVVFVEFACYWTSSSLCFWLIPSMRWVRGILTYTKVFEWRHLQIITANKNTGSDNACRQWEHRQPNSTLKASRELMRLTCLLVRALPVTGAILSCWLILLEPAIGQRLTWTTRIRVKHKVFEKGSGPTFKKLWVEPLTQSTLWILSSML